MLLMAGYRFGVGFQGLFRCIDSEGSETVVIGALRMVEEQLPRLDTTTLSVKKDDKYLSLLSWRT